MVVLAPEKECFLYAREKVSNWTLHITWKAFLDSHVMFDAILAEQGRGWSTQAHVSMSSE
jgi:hypothetical protein